MQGEGQSPESRGRNPYPSPHRGPTTTRSHARGGWTTSSRWPTHLSEGVYLGEGIPPAPAKLAARICRGEFVEMGELLPEFWSGAIDEDAGSSHEPQGRRSRKVTDIFMWLQCYGSYVICVNESHHSPAPDSRTHDDNRRSARTMPGWPGFDMMLCRQAALTGNTRWSVINPTLYTMCFTGKAAAHKRCELCFATSHTERECAQRGDPEPEVRIG